MIEEVLTKNLLNNSVSNKEIENAKNIKVTKENNAKIIYSVKTQQLRCSNARDACAKKNYLETFFAFLLFKIEEL